ncbi:type VI secretion system tip protein VgrG [Marimonas arenosa]|uniref:Type VI secretion system tip protein VgrG n=1 Tax=Marimonas arenosa TaxID=1795305 RepID=A0AAE3WBH2_9RHOB|nr:type VI secretion system tip protein VgrG [Marimonas arenosa]MDQ2088742.1 type VI secretion system tip protein VgrG [Marimonas arenosa]
MTRLLPITQNTDVTSVTVTTGGTALPGWVRLAALEVQRSVNRIPFARLQIDDGDPATADFAASASALFAAGQEITVEAGYHGEVVPIFSGVVLRQRLGVRDCSSWLEVECRDVASKMTLSRRNRLFEEMTDSDVIAEILGEYGIGADLAATEVTHPQLFQYQATDWDFVMARLDANGQFMAVEDGTLRSFIPELDPDAPVAEALFGANLIELDAEFDARSQTGGIVARAWDPAAQAAGESEAADPGWILTGDQNDADMIGATGRTGEEVWHGGALMADALQAWADGALRRSRIAGARGRVRFQGFAPIMLGQTLQLSGVGARFNGGVLVTGLRHAISGNTWTLDVEFGADPRTHAERFAISAPPASALSPAVSGLQVGVVTAIADDPGGEHRVRIRLPVSAPDGEGVWARLATLDAGAERGTFFRPEVDDEVVVGFFNDDPAFPVILGALHSSAQAPPEEPSAENHLKGYVSRTKLRLVFDDENGAVIVETPAGNSVTLSDSDGGILLADQNGNSIALTSDGITFDSAGGVIIAASGDVEIEGTNIGLAANAELKAEGSASAAVTSSGMVEVSGSLVKIN